MLRKTSFAAFALIVLAAAIGPVRGQDMPAPRDIPAARLDELRKRVAPLNLDEILRRCSVLRRTASEADQAPRGFSFCPFSCAPDDRDCEVTSKMHGRAGDDVVRLGTKIHGR
jgi:hypothetical protein